MAWTTGYSIPSVLIALYDVILRPLAMPVSTSSHGAWHTAATIFLASKIALTNCSAFGSTPALQASLPAEERAHLDAMMNYAGLRAEQKRLRERGIYRGIGFASFIEVTNPSAAFYGVGGARITSMDGATLKLDAQGNRPNENQMGGHLYQEAVRLFRTKKPIVVAVQGAAIGGGVGPALVGGFRVAAAEARFATGFSSAAPKP